MQVEMTKDEAQEFATWLRSRGQEYMRRADQITKSKRVKPDLNGGPIQEPNNRVTLEQFVQAIREKGGRIRDFANRLHTSEDHLERLMDEPNSPVSVGERGWLRARN